LLWGHCATTFTVSHGSAYTIARATQQVNEKWQFWGVKTL